MDISKMYCRVDSEHFDEFVQLVGEQFGESFSKRALSLSKRVSCNEVAISYYFNEEGAVEYSTTPSYWSSKYNYTEFTGSWTIYNNTKQLAELTDEQAAELFNYYRKGGEIECFLNGLNGESWTTLDPVWDVESKYRAKQKSERELFIETAAKIMFDAEGGGHEINDITLDALFDAGFKAPKGGE